MMHIQGRFEISISSAQKKLGTTGNENKTLPCSYINFARSWPAKCRETTIHSRVAELVVRVTDRYQLKIVQVYAPTTSHSDEETDNFYNTNDKILEKQTHYTCVSWRTNKYIRKGDRMLRPGPAK